MGINILKEISERAKKIEYISTESNRELNFRDLFNDPGEGKGVEDPRIDQISKGIGAILEKLDGAFNKESEEPSDEFVILFKSVLSTYDYIRDRKESMEPENMEVSAVIEDILKRFESELKKSDFLFQDPIGKQYDPDLHEKGAGSKNPDLEENIITKVSRCGVVYKGQIIRKAKVTIVQNRRKSRDKQE